MAGFLASVCVNGRGQDGRKVCQNTSRGRSQGVSTVSIGSLCCSLYGPLNWSR
jgi:hypothetical protein